MKEDNTYYDGMDGLNLPGSLRVNPFVVPENYFDQLSSSVLFQVRLVGLSNLEKTGFSVPESYFSQLTDNIQLHIKMEQYKEAVHEEWDTPKGYFEDLSDKILSQTRIESVVKQEEFDVPMGYFESLSERIQTNIFEDKLKQQISADGFTVPKDYTGILKDKIVAQTTGKERQKTIVRRLNFNKWIQYVAAACVALVIGIASYNSINNGSINNGAQASFSESHLSSIPDDEIINYLSALNDSHDILYIMECMNHSHDAEGICTHVKENDIEDYLNYAL
ncbi:hypothetical protein [Sphingobacterium chuzhouense]|uniref:Uncharacterized protein n=1 Tax=Sphingobacterium chuzhouense TaxID=1742264 RepID=A0ABR7XNX5_9SPHI|nr:hypothetical protein [Sphingobacterium chuzhouense]MBD1420214.1 hypothetical protein [Sphingobacterium chuzhouense]